MDLRKAILLKKPLQDSSFSSLNNSAYESAAEDSDNSLYYSFSNNSFKSVDNSLNEGNLVNECDPETSMVSEADKENTVIMKDVDDKDQTIEKIDESLEQEKKEDEKMEIDSVINVDNNVTKQTENIHNGQNVINKQILEVPSSEEKSVIVIPQITIQDPNLNLVNPFTFDDTHLPTIQEEQNSSIGSNKRKTPDTDKVAKSKLEEVNKKSASKIPTKTHFYSPVQRKSIDKKSKIITKPLLQRRTIYETRNTKINKRVTMIPPIQSKTAIPKPAPKASVQTIIHKCTVAGCFREFRTIKSLQEHAKTHKSHPSTSTSSHSSFKCKWCDKVFELNTALTSHMLEKCSKITFNEKRKLMAQQEKINQATDNKRRTVFVAPPPKKRSPRRQTLNKSGIMITPKKTLKCDCGKMFTDVLEFANHTVAHKYEGALKGKES